MQITQINVNAGRTFNHPHEDYSNLRADISLQAVIEDGEDPIEATKELQRQAESMVEDHKQSMISDIEKVHQIARTRDQLERAKRYYSDQTDEIQRLERDLINLEGEDAFLLEDQS